LIIDEYQDINLGQQTLIELLAGEQADARLPRVPPIDRSYAVPAPAAD
jgi:superfamily I DNA/RNA helicase